MGPMGLQCDKLQRDDLDHYWQPLQERRRGHGKTGNVSIGSKKRRHTKAENIKKDRRKTVTLRHICVVRIFVFQQPNMRKLDILRGV